MKARRVVITGLGLVTSLGENAHEVFEKLCKGESGIKQVTRFDLTDWAVRIGGECTNFNVASYGIDVKEARRLDRFGQFGIAASISAVKDSGIDFKSENGDRCGVIIGSGIGGIETLEEQNQILNTRGVTRVSPFTVPRLMVNAASGNVSIMFGLKGPNTAVATACATGSNAIGDAAKLIENNQADVMVAGGSEAALCRLGMASFIAARAMSTRNEDPTHASRPWDKERDGFVMGEGAGVVVLEEYEHAKKRGARIYAELVGYGMSADANHITAPCADGEGAGKAMKYALADAGVNPDQIDYINAHGTSTGLGDLAETMAVKTTFGAHAHKVAISSTKSALGHLLGASGGVEAIFATLSVVKNIIPPTINLDNPDEGCDLDFTPHTAKEKQITYALSNSFGFGGHNATLVVKKI